MFIVDGVSDHMTHLTICGSAQRILSKYFIFKVKLGYIRAAAKSETWSQKFDLFCLCGPGVGNNTIPLHPEQESKLNVFS